MVEFAIVLPLLALLLVMAVDFGRVFFGWVALQNAARIGADRVSQTANAWPIAVGPDELLAREEYESLILNDMTAANCELPSDLPEPTFEDVDGDGDPYDFGDLATVRLTCEFGLITPLAEAILGGPVTLSAEATFAIHGIVVMGVPDAPPLPCQPPDASFETDPPVPSPGPNRLEGVDPDPDAAAGFEVDFTDTSGVSSGCESVTYTWTFSPDGVTPGPLTGQSVTNEFNHTGGGFTDYNVTLTVTNERGNDSTSLTVRVRAP